MITEIRLENFKSFKELTKIPLKKITVFIGPNGAGKSTPLQALMLLKQADYSLRGDEGQRLFDVASPHNLSYMNRVGLALHIGLTIHGDNNPQKVDGGNLPVELVLDLLADVEGRLDQSSATVFREQSNVRQAFFQNVYFVPASRGFEKLYFTDVWSRQDISSSTKPETRPNLVASKLASSPKLRELVNQWLSKVTDAKVEYSLGPNTLEGGTVQVLSWVSQNETTNLINEGFGTNQLIHLLVQLALCPKGSFLAIEEPEAHLHPKAQVALVKVLLERAKEYDLQLVLITHSEHVLYTILNQVGKGSFTPKDVGLLYFKKEDGVSRVEERVINKLGQVKGGLPDFFEVELEQMSEFVEALGKQK